MPHTVEEAYELADAAHHGDDAKLLDELGDVLVSGHVPLAAARGARRGRSRAGRRALPSEADPSPPTRLRDTQVADASEVLRNWDAIKADEPGRERGVFGEVPENLPALLYARKLQRRAATAGLHPSARPAGEDRASAGAGGGAQTAEGPAEMIERRQCPQATPSLQTPTARIGNPSTTIGERLFALVDEARVAHVDPSWLCVQPHSDFGRVSDPGRSGPQELGPQGEK